MSEAPSGEAIKRPDASLDPVDNVYLFPRFLAQLLYTRRPDRVIQTNHARTAQTNRPNPRDNPRTLGTANLPATEEPFRGIHHLGPHLRAVQVMQLAGIEPRGLAPRKPRPPTRRYTHEFLDRLPQRLFPDLARRHDPE